MPVNASPRQQIRSVIFDMDGTLLDSERLSHKAWDAAAREAGECVSWETFLKMVGHRSADCIRILQESVGRPLPAATVMASAREHYARLVEAGVPLMPGAEAIFDFAKQRGWKIGIATSTRRESAQAKLRPAATKSLSANRILKFMRRRRKSSGSPPPGALPSKIRRPASAPPFPPVACPSSSRISSSPRPNPGAMPPPSFRPYTHFGAGSAKRNPVSRRPVEPLRHIPKSFLLPRFAACFIRRLILKSVQ